MNFKKINFDYNAPPFFKKIIQAGWGDKKLQLLVGQGGVEKIIKVTKA